MGAYTPKKTRIYEKSVIAQAIVHKFDQPLECAMSVRLMFFLPIPVAFSKKKRADAISGALRLTKKPDIDNLIKSILDPLNGIFWKDDKQIVAIRAEKYYGEQPCVEVEIAE